MPSATGSQLLCVEAFRHTAGVFDAAGRAGSPIDAVASRCAEELDSIFVCSLMLPATGFAWSSTSASSARCRRTSPR